MTSFLPESLEVDGVQYPINTDFRNILIIFQAFNDDELNDYEKAGICISRLYYKIPVNIEEAVRKAYWFCEGGDMPKSEPDSFKSFDWERDGSIIFPAVSKSAGVVDVRALKFLHWWTFLGLFGEIGEGLFSTVMSIRRKIGEGKKLEKWEQEFLHKNKEIIVLRSAEEQAAIDKTNKFLEELIGGD